MTTKLCMWFNELTRNDVPLAGGKGANLGDMAQANLPIPPGFVITAPAYQMILEQTGLLAKIETLLTGLDRNDSNQLQQVEAQIRQLFGDINIFDDLQQAILGSYTALGGVGS